MKSAIFKVLFLSLCIIANTHLAYAQTASILPQGKTQFLDNNGKPLTSGTVDFYIPSTTTRKTTWQNSGETVANLNPVVLDAGGRAIIYGDGSYRMVVKDRLGNLIYDQLTSSTGSGSTPSTSTGDGDLVGTVKPWAGMIAPSQYLFTYGQEISRTTYAATYAAITSTQAVFCNSGSPILNGLSDTTNFWVGMTVETSCLAAGFSTVLSKTASTVTLAANANVTTNVNATFFPWGRGNGTTTFNLPDFRGTVLAGNNMMGGVSGSNLTTTYFGATDPNSSGALGGNQSLQLTAANIPTLNSFNYNAAPVNSTSTITSIPNDAAGFGGGRTDGAGGSWSATHNPGQTGAISSTGTVGINALGTYGANSGGVAVSALVAAAGSGYTNGAQTITVSGGTCTTQPQFTVTVAGNVFTNTPVLLTAGSCTVSPANPASTTGGGGSGGTLNITYTGTPFSRVQPTRTTNYIIKVIPDSNSATASGVTSLGGMTGDITCGARVTCTGNTISVNTLAVAAHAVAIGFNSDLIGVSPGVAGTVLASNGTTSDPSFQAVPAVTSITPGNGLTSTLTATAPGSAITATGTLSSAQLVNAQTGASYAILDTDRAKLITASNAGAQAYTIAQAGAASAFQAGWFTRIGNISTNVAGIVTITPTTSTINGAATLKIQPGQSAIIFSDGSNYRAILGDGAQLPGTTTNDAANAGNIGEYKEQIRLIGSPQAITTATPANVTASSLDLTPGDWDIRADIYFFPANTTSMTKYLGGISTTSATIPAAPGTFFSILQPATVFDGATVNVLSIPNYRVSISSNTSYFLVAQATFTVSTNSVYGIISARRIR